MLEEIPVLFPKIFLFYISLVLIHSFVMDLFKFKKEKPWKFLKSKELFEKSKLSKSLIRLIIWFVLIFVSLIYVGNGYLIYLLVRAM